MKIWHYHLSVTWKHWSLYTRSKFNLSALLFNPIPSQSQKLYFLSSIPHTGNILHIFPSIKPALLKISETTLKLDSMLVKYQYFKPRILYLLWLKCGPSKIYKSIIVSHRFRVLSPLSVFYLTVEIFTR